MICNHCGFEVAEGSQRCPQCGAPVYPAANRPLRDRMLVALKDPLFLVVCILMSVSCLMSLTAGSVPLIGILITVFLWLTYAQAQKDILDANHLRCVSGAVYAEYIITYVLAGVLLVVGVLLAAFFGVIANSGDGFWNALLDKLADAETLALLSSTQASIAGIVLLVGFCLVAIVLIVVNIFTTRYLHRLAKSVYLSIQSGTDALKSVTAAKVVLFILGCFSALSCLFSLSLGALVSFVSSAADGGCTIICGILIRKYLE